MLLIIFYLVVLNKCSSKAVEFVWWVGWGGLHSHFHVTPNNSWGYIVVELRVVTISDKSFFVNHAILRWKVASWTILIQWTKNLSNPVQSPDFSLRCWNWPCFTPVIKKEIFVLVSIRLTSWPKPESNSILKCILVCVASKINLG